MPKLRFVDVRAKSYSKDPAVKKTLLDNELLRRSVFTTPPPPHIYCAVNPSLRRRDACKTKEMMSVQRGEGDSKSLCESNFTRNSKYICYHIVFLVLQNPLGNAPAALECLEAQQSYFS